MEPTIKIENLPDDGLNIRTGDLPDIIERQGFDLSANIDAPFDFCLQQRPAPETSLFIVSREDACVVFRTNINMPESFQDEIKGTVFVTNEAAYLCGGNSYAPASLGKYLRERAALLFEDQAGAGILISRLINLEAKVEKELKASENEERTKKSMILNTIIETNLPKSIDFKMRIIEGEDPVSVTVPLWVEERNGSVYATLDFGPYFLEDIISEVLETRISAFQKRTGGNYTFYRVDYR
jgi:hypothetical protein